MKNVTTRPEGQGSFELLIDPVYGPNSKFFWPGSFADASDYVLSPVRISSYVSGEEFLEMYVESFSGVLDYRQSSDYPDESYCDTLYDHFYNLYSHVESWDTSTLFVSAVYRDLFHEMFPYQSQLLELRTRLDYESILRPFLEEGRDDEAMKAAYGRPFNEADKGERKLFLVTCCRLMKLILARNTDLSLISELVKVLHRTNIVARNHKKLKEGLLFMLRDTHALPFPGDEMRRDLYRKKLVLALSLFEIEPKAAEKAVNDGLSSQSHEPITHLIRDRPSKRGFAGDEASAYRLGPHYTATDYINDLVLSEKAYNRIFEEVRNSAAEWEVTSVLMSFEEEGSKIGQLAYLEMIRELFQENTDQGNTPLLSIVDSAAKSFDEDDLIAGEEVPVTKKIFDKIGKKIDVPFKARKRIVEICNEQGIPKTEALAEKIISEVSSINKLSQKKSDSALEKFEQLVTTFCSLLALAVAILISRNSHSAV